MKNLLITILLVFGLVTLVGAQENDSKKASKEKATYQKYKFSVNFGRSFSNPNLVYLQSYDYYNSNAQPVVPYIYGINQTDNSAVNMIGAEFRWMFKPNWSINLSGLGSFSANHQQDFVMGVYDSDAGGYVVPNINSVPYKSSFDWNIEIGTSRYFSLPNTRLLPYSGISFLFAYGSDYYEQQFEDYDEYGNINPVNLYGMQKGEFVAWGFALPVGFEYYVSEGLFIGFSINVANYFYSLTQIAPGEGMDLARADQNTFSFFTRPILKIGIQL